MAKRKTPDQLTEEQLAEHKAKDLISNHATRSEKTAWQRQYDNLTKLIKKLEPIEDKLLALTTEKGKIIDDLLILRKELVENCIHPFDQLVTHNSSIVCKFCERHMAIRSHGESTEDEDGTNQNGYHL